MSTPGRLSSEQIEPASAAESFASGVSWPAVLAGAAVTAAIGFLLMTLGAGMGLSAVSPWPTGGLNATRVGTGAIVWIVITQLLACALGGYVAGRLRTKWAAVHTHEVYFRDTAHGLLVWAVAVVLTFAFLSSLATSLANEMSTGAAGRADPTDYFVDKLLRGTSTAAAPDFALRAEVRSILLKALRDPGGIGADRAYLAALAAKRTGISEAEASRRVDETVAEARQAVDTARKAVAHSLYWLVVALLVGAFSGSYAAILGGRRRDYVWA